MGNEIGRSMDMELGYEEETEVTESDEEEDEVEELEEISSPMLSCRIGADGKKHHEIVVNISDGFKNRLEMIEPCSICFLPFSTQGNHRICCLPCGHLYGFSCIKKWLQTSSGRKCPHCNTPCTYKDVILLYTSRASAYQKTSSTRHFPFTKRGLIEFKEHERLRRVDAKKMHAEDHKRLIDVLEHQSDVAGKRALLMSQLEDLSERCEKMKHDGFHVPFKRLYDALWLRYDALGRRYDALGRRYDALGRRYDTLGQRADVLEQRLDVLERWLSASKLTLKLFTQTYKEHVALQRKNTKPCYCCTATPTCHSH